MKKESSRELCVGRTDRQTLSFLELLSELKMRHTISALTLRKHCSSIELNIRISEYKGAFASWSVILSQTFIAYNSVNAPNFTFDVSWA